MHLRSLALLVVVALAASCSACAVAGECTGALDCGPGFACINGACSEGVVAGEGEGEAGEGEGETGEGEGEAGEGEGEGGEGEGEGEPGVPTRATDGLLALWVFDTDVTPIADRAQATSSGGPALSDGREEPAFQRVLPIGARFDALPAVDSDRLRTGGDADDDVREINDALTATGAFTVDAWLAPEATSGDEGEHIIWQLGVNVPNGESDTNAITLVQRGADVLCRARVLDATGAGDEASTIEVVAPFALLPGVDTYVACRGQDGRLDIDVRVVGGNTLQLGIVSASAVLAPHPVAPQIAFPGGVDAGVPFRGVVYLGALYDRALSDADIDDAFAAGFLPRSDDADVDTVPDARDACRFVANAAQVRVQQGQPRECPREDSGLVAAYRFADVLDDASTVRDVAGVGAPLDLTLLGDASLGGRGLRMPARGANDPLGTPSARAVGGPGLTRAYAALRGADAVTLEAWVVPASTTTGDVVQIVSSQLDNQAANARLGLDDTRAQGKVRATGGNEQNVSANAAFAVGRLTHVAVVDDAIGGTILYVDGVERDREPSNGNFDNWSASMPFQLGNVPESNRAFSGRILFAAVHARVLPPEEVARHRAQGPPIDRGDDVDGDGVPAEGDNCPTTANMAQGDVDGDGTGDACAQTTGGG